MTTATTNQHNGSRRVWIGAVSGLLAFLVLAGVAAGAYHAGRHHAVATQVVTSGSASGGEVVHVVGGHWGWGPGPFIFFPFLIIGLVILLVALTRRRHWDGPSWRGGYGPWTGGPYAAPGALDEWHRRAHQPPPHDAPPEPTTPGGA